jgi:hypothetical protein
MSAHNLPIQVLTMATIGSSDNVLKRYLYQTGTVVGLILSAIAPLNTAASAFNTAVDLPSKLEDAPAALKKYQKIVQTISEKGPSLQNQIEQHLQRMDFSDTNELSKSIYQLAEETQFLGLSFTDSLKDAKSLAESENIEGVNKALQSLDSLSSLLQQELIQLQALSLQINASQTAANWLAGKTKRDAIAQQVSRDVIMELTNQNANYSDNDKAQFFKDISGYLFLIQSCLSRCRFNSLDQAIQGRKIPTSSLPQAAYIKCLKLVKDAQIIKRDLSEEAENQLQIYLNYAITKIETTS